MVRFPSNTRDIINQIRQAIGRVVVFTYENGYTTCPICNLDPTTGLSTNSFCTICSGNYYIPNILTSGILAHITWKPANKENLIPAGLFIEGDVRVQIEHTDEHVFIVDNTIKMVVDGKDFEILEYEFRGVPEINRIVIYGRQINDGN